MLKVIALSDFHGQLINISEEADLFLICGDISPLYIQDNTPLMEEWLLGEFSEWVSGLPYRNSDSRCVLIGGNHDWSLEGIGKKRVDRMTSACDNRLVYLDNTLYIHKDSGSGNTYRIFGCPYVRMGSRWAFSGGSPMIRKYYSMIPADLDILMLHNAPDILSGGVATGLNPTKDFGDRILGWIVEFQKPRYVLFGHIHTSPVKELTEYNDDGCKICNVSILDEDYKAKYKPLVFQI